MADEQRTEVELRHELALETATQLANVLADALDAAAGRLSTSLDAHRAIFTDAAKRLRGAVEVPQITSTEPADGAAEIPTDQPVRLVFDRPVSAEAMKSLTVAPAAGGPSLAGTWSHVEYADGSCAIEWLSEKGLSPGVEYRATFVGDETPTGIAVPERGWSFTVAGG